MSIRSYRASAMAEVRAELARKNEVAAILVEGNVKGKTPVDTGRLRSSITHDSDGLGFIVGTNVSYAPYVELGTRYQKPQPYLVPGLMASIGDIQRVYGA